MRNSKYHILLIKVQSGQLNLTGHFKRKNFFRELVIQVPKKQKPNRICTNSDTIIIESGFLSTLPGKQIGSKGVDKIQRYKKKACLYLRAEMLPACSLLLLRQCLRVALVPEEPEAVFSQQSIALKCTKGGEVDGGLSFCPPYIFLFPSNLFY